MQLLDDNDSALRMKSNPRAWGSSKRESAPRGERECFEVNKQDAELALGERLLVDADSSILLEKYFSSFILFIKNLPDGNALLEKVACPSIIRTMFF